MIKVDNKETIHTLSCRFIKINRNRNIIAVIAIILTSILFTSVFTASFSVIKSTMESETRKTMDRSHVSVEGLTKEQYSIVAKDREIKKQGLSVFLTTAENEKLKDIQTEIRYADKNAADSFLCVPTTGELPENEDEIATSTIILDALGINHNLGEKVNLTYTLNDQKICKEFTLSGFWEGDSVAMAQLAWISKTYCDSVAPKITAKDIDNGNYEGEYSLCIWFSNAFNLEKRALNLAKRCNLTDSNASFSANPVYGIFEEDAFPFGAVIIILAIIMLSGYLIINNVFNISVNSDIRAYGLLKNIGTTGKQLKKIVRLQALLLSMVGIPIGMFFGFLVGKTMTPFLLFDGEAENNVLASISDNPAIFIVAALFSLVTIYAGCLKPCHIVESLSPVEAVRMTDAKICRKTKKYGNVSAFSMAFSNVKRIWRKGMGVVISLALSLMVLNMVYMIVKGFDFNRYTSASISSDFEVNGFTSHLKNANLNIITPEFKKVVKNSKGIASLGYIYYTPSTHKIDDTLYQNLVDYMKQNGIDAFTEQQQIEIQDNLDKRIVRSHVMGINEAAFNKIEFGEDSCTWEEFSSGKYVITDWMPYGKYYSVGDKVKVEFCDTKSKEYKVKALVNLPFTLSYYYYDGAITQLFLLPEKEYIKGTGNNNAMIATIDVKKGKTEEVYELLKNYRDKQDSNLIIKSRYDLQCEFRNYVNKYYMIGSMLTAVLFIIAVLNFFNTSATTILSRKKELSLLEAVGMTKKQVLKMLIMEGMFYLGVAYVLETVAGTAIACKLIDMSIGMVYFFNIKISILPSIIAIPILILIIVIVPIYNYNKMCKETVVERIRNEG